MKGFKLVFRKFKALARDAYVKGVARYHGYTVGPGTYVHPAARVRLKLGGSISIGSRCNISEYALIYSYGGNIRIGDDVSVKPFTVLYGHGGLDIGNYVRIATQTVVVPANHIVEDESLPIAQQGYTAVGVTIEDDVWIGSGVRILDGVRIARGCVIASGAVVTKSTEPFGIYGGVPAKWLKRRGAGDRA